VLWAVEVKGANIELLGKAEEKELFREYMEDFNTGTLPHK
jgi:carbamoylphosphate synthase large subunit